VASTKDRQRALERARYERVQAKMQAKRREARRKTRLAVVSSIAAVVVIAAVVGGVIVTSGSSSNTKAAAAGSTASTSAAASATAGATPSATGNPLEYEASGTSAVKGIGLPTFDAAEAEQTYTATIQTNLGDIVFTADGKAAPYTVYSFLYLADKGYFNNTKCHRLTTSGIYVLQCGDPTGTGSGGPGYTIPDENLASLGTAGSSGTVTYKAGTVAMANTGQPHSGGSQFFLVYKDSPLAPTYTPFGTITQGLNILQQIAAKGSNNANGTGDGAPNEAVTIEKFTMTKS
jgi:peptidyl-prolyl cis-trans isomerase B (cyclophilin B)